MQSVNGWFVHGLRGSLPLNQLSAEVEGCCTSKCEHEEPLEPSVAARGRRSERIRAVINRVCELMCSASGRDSERMQIHWSRTQACSQVRRTRQHSGGRLVPGVSNGMEMGRVHQIDCFVHRAA
jgi:hypothetical protein